jgi:uncharacterized membrane protein YcaP (DUF421 family)
MINEGLVVLVRGLISFFTLLIYTRILGKQQVTQLTFFDYILGITIGSIAASMTVDLGIRAWPHFVGLTLWFILVLTLHLITLKSRKLSDYLDGKPTIVIDKGKILNQAMKENRLRLTDLVGMLRQQGVFDVSEVECAILESDGELSVLKKSQFLPLTPNDMKMQTKYKGLNTILIYDGEILRQNLKDINHDEDWLMKVLKKENITSISEVFFASADPQDTLYVSKYKYNIAINGHDTFSNKESGEPGGSQ